MYDGVIRRDFSSNSSARGKLINFGGKNKLREIMMNGELILAMSPAMNVKNGLATLVSDDVLVVTNKRLILLEKKIKKEWKNLEKKYYLIGLRKVLAYYLVKVIN